jgi:hypothetical protein
LSPHLKYPGWIGHRIELDEEEEKEREILQKKRGLR